MKLAFMKFCISTEFGNVKVGFVWKTMNILLVFIVKLPFWDKEGIFGSGVGGFTMIIVQTEGSPMQLYPEETAQFMHPRLYVAPESQAYLSLIKPSPQILLQMPCCKS